MDARNTPPTVDRRIAALARRQHGVVALRQLTALGLGRGAVASRVRAGRLHRVRLAVYAVGHTALSADGHLMAAVLACGPGAVLSHQSAAAVWRVRAYSGSRPHVTVCNRVRRRPDGITIHRPRVLPAEEVTERRGLPVTTPARTLLDLADVLDADGLRHAVEQAEVERVFDLRAVEAVAARHPGRALRRLRTAVDAHDETFTRSDLERAFLRLCRDHGLPRPQVNVRVGNVEVDFLWREHALVVEVDGFRTHGTRAAFERDRRRDGELAALGLRVLRFTDRRVRHEAGAAAAVIAQVMAG